MDNGKRKTREFPRANGLVGKGLAIDEEPAPRQAQFVK